MLTRTKYEGSILGQIWMPAAVCSKEFSFSLEGGPDLEAAKDHLLLHECGDFQEVIDYTIHYVIPARYHTLKGWKNEETEMQYSDTISGE